MMNRLCDARGIEVHLMKVVDLLLLLVCASSIPVLGQDLGGSGNATTILALEHEWVEGQTHNDNRALDLIFDNGLVYIEYGRLVSKGEYLSRIKEAGPQLNQIVMEPMAVRMFGKTAIVVGTYREKERKDSHASVRHWRFIDTWVYKKNGWVLVAAASAPISR